MTNLIKINPNEFGLSEETAQNITKDLPQILKEREVLESQYNEVIQLDINDPKTAKKAGELRKLIKDNRTKGIEKWHKVNKEYFLKGGQFIDAIRRKESLENERMEDNLEQIEKHQENLEKQRIADLNLLRFNLISGYIENADKMDFGNMANEIWEAFYSTKKKEYEDKLEAERLAEIERQKLEEEKRIEEERVRIENERLRKEAEEREKQIEAERKQKEEELRIEREKAQKERLERDAIIEAERKKAQKEADRLAKIAADKLAAEKAEREKIEKELQAKKDAELAAEKKRIEEEKAARLEAEKLAKAPIKKQLSVWVESFQLSESTIDHEAAIEIKSKFEAFKNWAKQTIENI